MTAYRMRLRAVDCHDEGSTWLLFQLPDSSCKRSRGDSAASFESDSSELSAADAHSSVSVLLSDAVLAEEASKLSWDARLVTVAAPKVDCVWIVPSGSCLRNLLATSLPATKQLTCHIML